MLTVWKPAPLRRLLQQLLRQLKHLLDLEREGKVLIVAPRVKAEMDTLGRDKDVIEKLYYEGYDNAAPIEAFIKK